jgi:hypothetical protein
MGTEGTAWTRGRTTRAGGRVTRGVGTTRLVAWTTFGRSTAGNSLDASTIVVVGPMPEPGSAERVACWEPEKIAGSANEAPTAPASNKPAIARRKTTLMEIPPAADILLRDFLRQCVAEA